MIELHALHKIYTSAGKSIVALENINLQINAGEIFGIIGKSGAGKSSLLRMFNLLEKPTQGKVIFDGQSLTTLSATALRKVRQQMGMIFQHFNLISVKTVYENIALPLVLAKCDPKYIKKRVNQLLALVELDDRANAYPNELSGGQKQRVAIARALATEPKVLLCDEATSALDPHMTRSILNLLKKINEQLNITIILITHEMDVIKSICDSVAVLERGQIIEKASVIQFFVSPQSPQAKQLVSEEFKQELPIQLQQRLSVEQHPTTRLPLLRLSFEGRVASEPLIAQLIQRYELGVNILQANIETIHNHTIGILVIEVVDHLDKLEAAINYLIEQGVRVEIIGYVS